MFCSLDKYEILASSLDKINLFSEELNVFQMEKQNRNKEEQIFWNLLDIQQQFSPYNYCCIGLRATSTVQSDPISLVSFSNITVTPQLCFCFLWFQLPINSCLKMLSGKFQKQLSRLNDFYYFI